MAADTGSGKSSSSAGVIFGGKWQLSMFDRSAAFAVTPDGLRCQSREFKEWQGGRATKGVSGGGKYYYETVVLDNGLCRVGWSTQQASLDLGADLCGFGFGVDGKKSNNKQFDTYGEPFGIGDVIGCCLDLDNAEIKFMKNGNDLGIAFKISQPLKNEVFYPAVVLKNAEILLNFGDEKFKHEPPVGFVAISTAESAKNNPTSSPKACQAQDSKLSPQAMIIKKFKQPNHFHSQVALQTTPSTASSPFKLKNYNEFCLADEDLPSKNISELWKRPMKLSTALTDSNTPTVQRSGNRKRNQRTPSRRNVLPPTKLVFDNGSAERSALRRPEYRRSMSFPETSSCETPVYKPKRLKLQVNEEISPYEDHIKNNAALKEFNENVQSTSLTPVVKKLFLKSQSDSILSSSIKTALEKIEGDPMLIGDATTSYFLPIKPNGKHQDLKEIEGETLANLMETKEDCPNISFKIIDCRYPYEFKGGHIRGALNIYTKNQIQEELLDCKLALTSPSGSGTTRKDNNGREILIFHCEFSSKRGPDLCRHLRHIDRTHNTSTYPFLFYPELYVLYGGYKEFFEQFPHLCDPQDYVTMAHPDHADKYRRYKSESKLLDHKSNK